MYGTYISGARGIPGEDDKDDEALSLAESATGSPAAPWKPARPELALSNAPAPSPPPTAMYSSSFAQGQWRPFKLEPNRRAPDDVYGPEGPTDVENGYENLRSQTTAAGTGIALTYEDTNRRDHKRRPRMTQMSHFVQSFRSPIGAYRNDFKCLNLHQRPRLTLHLQISDVKYSGASVCLRKGTLNLVLK